MPSFLCSFNFLLADIHSHHSLQIKHTDTLNMAVPINTTEVFKRDVQIYAFIWLTGIGIASFSLVFIPKNCNYVWYIKIFALIHKDR